MLNVLWFSAEIFSRTGWPSFLSLIKLLRWTHGGFNKFFPFTLLNLLKPQFQMHNNFDCVCWKHKLHINKRFSRFCLWESFLSIDLFICQKSTNFYIGVVFFIRDMRARKLREWQGIFVVNLHSFWLVYRKILWIIISVFSKYCVNHFSQP